MNEIDKIKEFVINKSSIALTDLSLNKNNGQTLTKVKREAIDFDLLNGDIKTADGIFFKGDKIIFVEFKSGHIGEIDYRLKATESFVVFISYLLDERIIDKFCYPYSTLEFYIVFNKNYYSSTTQIELLRIEKKLNQQYKFLFSKYKIIDNYNFDKLFI
jgi:hypothetical protein